VEAIQALARDPAHKRALDWIIREACMTYDETFFPDERNSAYAQGRRGVGLAIVKLVNYPPAARDALRRPKTPAKRGKEKA
jgi:hypothetical protein